MQKSAGFTIIELLVVVSIIAILASTLLLNFSSTSASGRDAKRQADLRALQNAIELYKNKYGRYPEGCRGANNWSGQPGTDFACPVANSQYIVGLAPEFIRVLPRDPRPVSGQQGYVYVTNADGSVYKLMAMNVVESEIVTPGHEFASCPRAVSIDGTSHLIGTNGYQAGGWCSAVTSEPVVSMNNQNIGYGPNRYFSSETTAVSHCNFTGSATGRFERSYGVWGGVHRDTIERIEGSTAPTAPCPTGTVSFDSRTLQRKDGAGNLISPIAGNAEWQCRARALRATAGILCQ